jgi:hypothetical protein
VRRVLADSVGELAAGVTLIRQLPDDLGLTPAVLLDLLVEPPE